MKNFYKYLLFLVLAIMSCEPENPVDETGIYSSGEANFSTYVALGNSLTAGYADGALYRTGQENSYPNILAQQFEKVQETNGFTQPLMNDNTGGLLAGGMKILSNRLVLTVGADGNPVPGFYAGTPTTDILNVLSGPFNNMGTPGAKSFHLIAPNYGNLTGVIAGTANPYFVRFASSPEASILGDALAQAPTFFTLWIGSNDVLGYASSGGVGEDQTGNLNTEAYGTNDITDPNVFAAVYSQMVTALTGAGAEGILINIPEISSVPYFTTIPNNALILDAENAASLTGIFQAVAGIFSQGLLQQGTPAEQAQALAVQYAIVFNEGPNRYLIDVPETRQNPLGFRQMTEEELLVLTIDQQALGQGYGSVVLTPEVIQVLGVLQQGGQPTPVQAQLVLDAVSGIDDRDSLDSGELENITTATAAYNTGIRRLAEDHGLAYADIRSLLAQTADEGIPYDAGILAAEFITGGAFSLDGIHPSPRGQAAMVNEIIEQINVSYNSTVPKVNIGSYPTVTFSNDVQ